MAKRRSNAQLARDRRKIADLYLQGWIQADIAEELDLDQSTISRDLAKLQDEWKESALVDIDAKKAEELAKVDRLEREYWSAWEDSCQDAETIRQEGSQKPDGNRSIDKVVKTAKGQAGDPRFLSGVQWCINKRCEIIGIDAPKKHEHTGKVEIKEDEEQHNRSLSTLANALRTILSGEGGAGGSAVDPAE